MPQRPYTQSIPAGATFDPLDSWQHQYTERPGILKVLDNATVVGLRRVVTATDITIVQDSPVTAGGTSGVYPSDFNAPAVIERVPARKRLSITYTNPTAGAIIVNGVADLTYGGGRRK